MPKFDITPEKLRELYIDQGLTAKQIAEQHLIQEMLDQGVLTVDWKEAA